MYVARGIPVEHKDLIHDVAFDYHGRRMATCSSDQSVKIWDLADNGIDWICTASWKTHSGSVWRVTWAHPEFGQVIATCSFDRTAAVWEEIGSNPKVSKLSGDQSHQKHWIKRSVLVDSRTSVTDVKFAPKHLGLQLATCSVDGIVRIYEAPDVMNLSGWTVQHEIQNKLSCSCLSWNTSRVHAPMLAIGSNDSSSTSGAKVHLYDYNDPQRKWSKTDALARVTEAVNDVAFAPNLGRSYHMLAVAAKDVKIFVIKPKRASDTSGTSGGTIEVLASFDEHSAQVWRLSWNVTGTILASSGDDGTVRLWKANYMGNWKSLSVMKGDGTSTSGNSNSNATTTTSGSSGMAAHQQHGAYTTNPPVPSPAPPAGNTRYYKMGSVSRPSQAAMLH